MDKDGQNVAGSAYALAGWLREKHVSYRDLALKLTPAVSKAAIGLWCGRRVRPSEEYRKQIEVLSEGVVRAELWMPSIDEQKRAERIVMESELIFSRSHVRKYVVLTAYGKVRFESEDVAEAKRYLDTHDECAKLIRHSDGAVLSFKEKLDDKTRRYLEKQFARAV